MPRPAQTQAGKAAMKGYRRRSSSPPSGADTQGAQDRSCQEERGSSGVCVIIWDGTGRDLPIHSSDKLILKGPARRGRNGGRKSNSGKHLYSLAGLGIKRVNSGIGGRHFRIFLQCLADWLQ